MWSAPIRCAQPPSDSTPWMVSTFDPMPSMRAPIAVRRWHRSCTWGSQAAFAIVVLPRASTAAMTAFSVPVTDASSRYRSAPRRPAGARSR